MSTFAARGKASARRIRKRFEMDCTLTNPNATEDPDTGTVTDAPVSMEIKVSFSGPVAKLVNGQLIETSEPTIRFDAGQAALTTAPENGFYATISGETYLLKGVQTFESNNAAYAYAATLGGTN